MTIGGTTARRGRSPFLYAPGGPPTLYLRRMLFHLRPLRRDCPDQSIPAGTSFSSDSVELAVPGLRYRQNDVSTLMSRRRIPIPAI